MGGIWTPHLPTGWRSSPLLSNSSKFSGWDLSGMDWSSLNGRQDLRIWLLLISSFGDISRIGFSPVLRGISLSWKKSLRRSSTPSLRIWFRRPAAQYSIDAKFALRLTASKSSFTEDNLLIVNVWCWMALWRQGEPLEKTPHGMNDGYLHVGSSWVTLKPSIGRCQHFLLSHLKLDISARICDKIMKLSGLMDQGVI